jgi:RNA polymerase sigma-70 factor (ECF subfamily)
MTEVAAIREESLSDATDRALIERLRSGDHEAFHLLYERHVRSVYYFAYSISGHAEDAEESAQETWIALWNGRGGITLHSPSALPWLLVTARHKSLDRAAAQRRRRAHEVAEPSTIFAEESLDASEAFELAQAVRGAVSKLSAIDQEIFRLCIDEGESYQSAAASLGVEMGVVRNRLSRLRRTLRLQLARSGAGS